MEMMNRSVEAIDRSIPTLRIVKPVQKNTGLIANQSEKRLQRSPKTVKIYNTQKSKGEIKTLTVFMPRNGLMGLL